MQVRVKNYTNPIVLFERGSGQLPQKILHRKNKNKKRLKGSHE